MCPDLVTEIILQPVRRYGVDAAIFLSDIVVPLKAIGVDLDIRPGIGPVVANPIRSRADLDFCGCRARPGPVPCSSSTRGSVPCRR
jgi:Uroporphyrinogen decarboxylase (URO-D)